MRNSIQINLLSLQIPFGKVVTAGAVTLLCAGCTGTDNQIAQAKNTDDVDEFVQQWRQLKPEIEQLSALKSDLAIILEEVNKHTSLNNLPAQYQQHKPEDHIEADEDYFSPDDSIEDGTAMPEGESEMQEKRQAYAAHVGYFLTENAARQGWAQLTYQYPAVVNYVTAKVASDHGGQQPLFSLRMGPFYDDQATARVCGALSSLNYRCRIVNFEGVDIDPY